VDVDDTEAATNLARKKSLRWTIMLLDATLYSA